ncbi:TetR/AcrR family transcriptional regulator [Streptomyces sp. RB6PN25]|uniref:TetR/AcrR family transcriptional regulator n=1 Tax=Streptomyces humicola TaxID=2953240 RepID=A0ABT1PQ82_9ACTN|nr:TetR/AcrR family transcriptional regulator [Streptomyces humicola]MCQ4079834.1 TetR/AcrR family transcriptional regulator [Streptomyces humicola]
MSTAHRRKGSDTKAEIQDVALALFTERGYDATSMREIAEHLGITKAALYYHFAGKEEIVRALIEELFTGLDELTAWAREQPPTPAVRGEVLIRWAKLSGRRGLQMSRFAAANQQVLHDLAPDRGGMVGRVGELVTALLGPDATVRDQVRARVALFSISVAAVAGQGLDIDDSELLGIILDTAFDLMPDAQRPAATGAGTGTGPQSTGPRS